MVRCKVGHDKVSEINMLEVRQVVAENLQYYRMKSGLTQSEVAREIGVTYQQVQKYENGKNRVSAESLYLLSHLYDVCVHQFFL